MKKRAKIMLGVAAGIVVLGGAATAVALNYDTIFPEKIESDFSVSYELLQEP